MDEKEQDVTVVEKVEGEVKREKKRRGKKKKEKPHRTQEEMTKMQKERTEKRRKAREIYGKTQSEKDQFDIQVAIIPIPKKGETNPIEQCETILQLQIKSF